MTGASLGFLAFAVPLSALAQSAPCTLAATHGTVFGLQVTPADDVAPFSIGAIDTAIVATLDERPSARVHVASALAFDATHEIASLLPTVARVLNLEGGVVHLGRGAVLSPIRPHAASLDAVFEPGSGIHVAVRVDCAALTLDEVPRDDSPPPAAAPRVPFWHARGPTLRIRARPNGTVGVDVRLDPDAWLQFQATAMRGPWLRMSIVFDHGSRLAGWVAQAEVEPTEARDDLGDAYGYGIDPSCCAPAPNTYCGPASVVAGTVVSAERGRGAWATVPDGVRLTVRHADGDRWVEIVDARGVRAVECEHHAWVPFASVRWPVAVVRRAIESASASPIDHRWRD